VALGPCPRQARRLSASRIVGIALVRNEDVFVETVLRNVAGFCDEIYVADHGSIDRTPVILRALAGKLSKIHYKSVQHPAESHSLIRDFASSPTWIFGVDGDEIYEPDRLARLRRRILLGDFDKYWMLLGNVLHVTKLATDRRTARGHLAPPCRSMTKLYNFNAIESWGGYTPERLHGGDVRFRAGFTARDRRMLHEEMTWDEADFRCLHLCFLKRSSLDSDNTSRPNIIETFGPTRLHALWYRLARMLGLQKPAEWKRTRYMRGPEVQANVETFFPDRT
jgi:glycosyltransferase involved in cell wall biosynthesis